MDLCISEITQPNELKFGAHLKQTWLFFYNIFVKIDLSIRIL